MAAMVWRRIALVGLGLALLTGCGGEQPAAAPAAPTGPDVPIGILKSDTDGLIVFLAEQCADADYPTKVTVANYDPAKQAATTPVLWEVATDRPDLLATFIVGKLPYGFKEVSNNVATQGIGTVLRITVVGEDGADRTGTFDTSKLKNGQLIDSQGAITNPAQFRDRWGCGSPK